MSQLKDIHFFDAWGLARKFRAGEVTEYQVVKHLLVTLILGGIGFGIPVSLDVVYGPMSQGEFLLDLLGKFFSSALQFLVLGLITFYWMHKIYKTNCAGDAKDFIPRFTALALPVGLQLAVGFGLAMLAFVLVFPMIGGRGEVGLRIVQVVPYITAILFYVMFFVRVRYYIGIAAGSDGWS
jgi:hypothetical protein